MPSASRLIDVWSGICCCHNDPTCISMTGYIISASPNVVSSGRKQGHLLNLTIGACGHPGRIVTGTRVCIANNFHKAIVTSQVTGCNIGKVISGDATHQLGFGAGGFSPISVTPFQGGVVVHTEVDFGNVDDDPDTDDGLNIYPPVTAGETPTAAQIARSNELDVSPTTTVASDSTADPVATTPPTSCIDIETRPPDNYVLSTNFTLGDLSANTAISKRRVIAQAGLTVSDMVCNLKGWAENVGEALSAKYSRDEIMVTSGFRNGSGKSQHERGQAADIQFPNFTDTEIYNASIFIRDNIPYDQLILEYGGQRPWIHISFNRVGNRSPSSSNKFGTRISPGNYDFGTLRNMA